MARHNLKNVLERLGLRQAEFARLLDVSPRTVSVWATGDTPIPGPVSAYLGLLQMSDPGIVRMELGRIEGRHRMLDEGIYGLKYTSDRAGDAESGNGLAVLRNGKILGSDRLGGVFAGSYEYDPVTKANRVHVRLEMRPGGTLVTGFSSGPEGATIDVVASLDARRPSPRLSSRLPAARSRSSSPIWDRCRTDRRAGLIMIEKKGQAPSRRVLLGEIAGVHGIRGAVVIKVYTSEPERIAAYGPLDDESGRQSYVIAVERVTDKGVIARVNGVADRTAAEKLKGTKLYLPRERLPAPEPGEYYHADLIGLEAVDPSGVSIGKVVAIPNYGAGDLVEIRLAGSKRTELVPFTAVFVPAVDLSEGKVTIAMPEYIGVENENRDAGKEDDSKPPRP